MTNVVDSYRRSHADAAPRKSRRWLALGVLLGVIASGALVAALATGGLELPAYAPVATIDPAVPALRVAATAKSGASDATAVASASNAPHLVAHGIMDGPVTGLIIVGIGLMTGLMVYLGLGRLLPANEPQPHPYELVRGRREVTQERRYHGGPIRD